jgi:hypothetical protein
MLPRCVYFGAVLATTFAIAIPAAFANSSAESIKITGNAELTAAGVLVQVTYSCLPSTSAAGFVFVEVQQGSLDSVMESPATCDDRNHTIQVEVPGAFHPGTAQAQALVENDSFVAFAQTGWVELRIA